MDTIPSTGTARRRIEAPAEVVYDLVADVARMGEWSPECVGADIAAGGALTEGATFTGRNARDGAEWSSPCVVVAAERPHRFSFTAGDPEAATTWTYELTTLDATSTEVTESFDSVALRNPAIAAQLDGRHQQLLDDLEATLGALAAVAERETDT